jgi:oligopeptide transport system substrate-binding protein
VLTNIYEGLTRVGPGGRIVPGIASKIEVSKDKRSYTFFLRNALWSDGVPVMAKDFAFALGRVMDPKTAAQYAYIVTDTVERVDVLGERTLRILLKRPTPYFLWLTAFPAYLPLRQDLLEALGQSYGTSPERTVFNGPFVVVAWKKGSKVVLEKNLRYWDKEAVLLKGAEFVVVKDPNTLVQMYDTGALSLIYQVPTVHLPRYAGNPWLKPRPEAVTDYIVFNLHRPDLKAFQNPKIRKALSLVLDRQAYCANVDRQSLPAYGFVPPTISGDGPGRSFRAHFGERFRVFYDPLTSRPYKTSVWFEDRSIEEAKALFQEGLKESGQKELTFSLLIDDTPQARRLGQVLQFFWQKHLGVKVSLDPVTYQTRLARVATKDYDAANVLWGADYDDPMTFLDLFTTGSPFNDPGFSNPAYDALIEKARRSSDQAERMTLFVHAEKLLMQESPVVPVFYRLSYALVPPYLKGAVFLACGADGPLKWASLQP